MLVICLQKILYGVFYSHLLSELYLHNEADAMVFCGDYNGRIGKCDHVNLEVDKDVVKRISIDTVKNTHGGALLEFIADGKLALLNSRVDPNNDNYTFISSRRKSVVNYFIVPQGNLRIIQSRSSI